MLNSCAISPISTYKYKDVNITSAFVIECGLFFFLISTAGTSTTPTTGTTTPTTGTTSPYTSTGTPSSTTTGTGTGTGTTTPYGTTPGVLGGIGTGTNLGPTGAGMTTDDTSNGGLRLVGHISALLSCFMIMMMRL